MADKKLTLIVDAKNQVGNGLDAAAKKVKTFARGARDFVNMIFAPLAVGATVAAAIVKITDFAVEQYERAGKALRAIRADNAAAAMDSLKQSINLTNREYAELTQQMHDASTAQANQTKATRALTDARMALAKAQELAALDPGDDAGRKRIESYYDEVDAAQKAARSVQDLRTEQAELAQSVALKMRESTDIGDALKDAQNEFARLSKQAAEYRRLANEATSGAVYSKYAEERSKSYLDEAATFEKLAKTAMETSVSLADRQSKLRAEALAATQKAAALAVQIEAASIEERAGLIARKTALEKEAAEKTVEVTRASVDNRKQAERELLDLKREQADIEKQLVDELADKHEQAWKDQKKQAEDILKMFEGDARDKIKNFLENKRNEAKEERLNAKQAERDADKAARLQDRLNKGGGIGNANQRWLDAFNVQQNAKNNLNVANQNLDAIQKAKDSANLDAMRKALEKNLANQEKLLAMG